MAIDREETKNSLFGEFQKSQTSKVVERGSSGEKRCVSRDKFETSALPKWKTLEKVTVLLSSKQKDLMDDVARKIMRFRHKGGSSEDETERITANSVVRGVLDNVMERIDNLDLQNIRTEEELKSWLSGMFKE